MPRKRPLGKYPARYYDIFRNGAKGKVTLDCGTAAKARSLRSELYTLRYVMRDSMPETTPELLAAERCTFSVAGAHLIVQPKEPVGIQYRTVSGPGLH